MKEEKGNDLLGSGGTKMINDEITTEGRRNCPFIRAGSALAGFLESHWHSRS